MKTEFEPMAKIVGGIFSMRGRQGSRTQGKSGFLSLLLCGLAFISPLFAATNDLTSTLQKGLFEEEANHNLEAAAQAYQNVSAQFDKDRKLAATAIFRLGEIYRKQGRTNEAIAQYDRIVRDFSDQTTLVSMSRQNLGALGSAAGPADSPAGSPVAEQEYKYQFLSLRLAQAKNSQDAETTVRMLDDEGLTKLWLDYRKLYLGNAFGTNNASR